MTLGDNVVLWSGNHIGHHSRSATTASSRRTWSCPGSVDVGENSFLGVNSTLVNDISIGRDTWLGPNVTITRDVEPGSVYRIARSERRDVSSYQLFGVEPSTGGDGRAVRMNSSSYCSYATPPPPNCALYRTAPRSARGPPRGYWSRSRRSMSPRGRRPGDAMVEHASRAPTALPACVDAMYWAWDTRWSRTARHRRRVPRRAARVEGV